MQIACNARSTRLLFTIQFECKDEIGKRDETSQNIVVTFLWRCDMASRFSKMADAHSSTETEFLFPSFVPPLSILSPVFGRRKISLREI